MSSTTPTPHLSSTAISGRPEVTPGPAARGGLAALVDAVRHEWDTSGEFSPQTLARAGEMAERFARRLAAQGVRDFTEVRPDHCRGFIDAPTSSGQPAELTTRHARRTALRMLFRTLRDDGQNVGDPTLDLALPARTQTTARPLTDAEITLCRASTRLGEAGAAHLQRATTWALAETTALTSEISTVRIGDLDDPAHPRWVSLPGTRRTDPRLGELTEWGAAIVARHVRVLLDHGANPATLLTYRGRGTPGQDKAQSATCNAVGSVLDLAGLRGEPDVRPASVRNWAGRRLYDHGLPLEQVARRMGAWGLDVTATAIGLTWRTP